MESTRVVLKLPRMLSDIVRELLDARADVEVVAVLDGAEHLQPAVQRYSADLVIVSEDAFRVPPDWLDLLDACPGLRFLAVASEGHRSALCEVLGDVAPRKLVTVVASPRARA